MANIARSYAAVGQQEKASDLFAQALEIARTIEKVSQKIPSLSAIAANLCRAGQYLKADEICLQALEIIPTIEDDFAKVHALQKLLCRKEILTIMQ